MTRWPAVLALALALGCAPSLGDCDNQAALEIVYDPAGSPAFAGQALMVTGCGGGAFCHAEGVPLMDRFGAPVDLDFDLRIASSSTFAELPAVDRLARHQQAIVRERHLVWEQIERGFMPPPGSVGPGGYADSGASYERVDVDGVTFRPLPGLDDPDARELARNWLACGAPVIERTQPREDRLPSDVGFEISACERDCVDLTWPALLERAIAPGCATASCHDDDAPAAALDLSGESAAAHARLVGVTSASDACGATMLDMVTPMDADASLLFAKVNPGATTCGMPMPLSGNPLSEQRLCALRAWIECGACPEADGGACRACIEGRRAECGVQLVDGAAECIEQAPCEGFAQLPM